MKHNKFDLEDRLVAFAGDVILFLNELIFIDKSKTSFNQSIFNITVKTIRTF